MPRTPPIDLLTVGEAFEDLVFAGLPRLPLLGEELRTERLVRTVGGGVVITAVAAARLGLRCAVMSGLGAPAIDLLAREGVAVRNLRRGTEPHAVTVALSTRADRSFVTFDGVNTVLQDRFARALVKKPARHVHLAFQPKSCRGWAVRVRALRARGATTSWDFGWSDALAADRGLAELLSTPDLVFVNEAEAKLYSGCSSLERATAFFRTKTRATIIKLGPRGARWVSPTQDLEKPTRKVRVVDTTGAGDAFNGGFLFGWLRGRAPDECLRLGNAVGSLSTRAAGGIDALPESERQLGEKEVSLKLAIVGAAGARTPLLVRGLLRSRLPALEVSLYDPDRERLGLMADLAERLASPSDPGAEPPRRVRFHRAATSAECFAGADFVFLSIRVGGMERRARDESIALSHGVVGQETVGPAGFAMAVRTVPEVIRYAEEAAVHAPRAWIINFTNPVGIVTQAVRQHTSARFLGICDTPTELFEAVALALGVPSAECRFDYFGLNHLGWLRGVEVRGEPALHRLFEAPERLASVYRNPLFPPELLGELGLLPTEYLYYYYRARDAQQNLARSGQTRGDALLALNRQLFDDLRAGRGDPVELYERYVRTRDAGYMQIESGAATPAERAAWADLTGYDKIAVAVAEALHFGTGAILPLDVSNAESVTDLDRDDVVEVPCVLGADGPSPLSTGSVPLQVRELLTRVKAYERLTIRAALERSLPLAREALAVNPLVDDPALAARLVDALEPLW